MKSMKRKRKKARASKVKKQQRGKIMDLKSLLKNVKKGLGQLAVSVQSANCPDD